nr:unnamed protein product [Digitaria exilis]
MDCSKRSAGAVASLPEDPLVEILSRVPFKSICRFKCVSKAWRDLIADPLHRKKLPQTLEGFLLYEDSEDCGSKDRPRLCVHFVDVLGRSVRPLDPCFSFLAELPGNENIMLLHYCNDIFLFARPCNSDTSGLESQEV